MRLFRFFALMMVLGLPAAGFAQNENASGGAMTATDKIVQRFMDQDIDENGGISFDEYMEMVYDHAAERFAQMDANGDGEVSSEEYRTFWKARMAKYYRLKK